ncbi:MAG: pyridoxamine 5'-phosphate oxidase family protein [Oscillospiraceae bacterium]|jgi:uncharacterized pyridoxamine 5'-phosphate oxidase family protein|nr:pyridoxamine 5'-phosphate oxidase family protein [Oscillospiraceae bacterium]
MSNKATELLAQAGTFFIATVEGDQPRVRPFGASAEIDGKTYICLNNTKKVYAQLIANPKIEITATVEGGNWFRITAKAVRDNTNEARAKMLEANPGLGGMYKADDGIYEVFYLDDVHGAVESFSGSKEEF